MREDATSAAGPSRIRQLNRRAVLDYIRRHGATPRSGLVHAVDLSPTAVSSVVAELIEDGLLREAEAGVSDGRMGRPVLPLELNPDATYTLGMVLRPRADQVVVELAWSDYAGRVSVVAESPRIAANDLEVAVTAVRQALSLLEHSVPDSERISSLVIGIPGVVVADDIRIAPRIKAIEGNRFVQALTQHVSYSLHFQNDVNLAALAELDRQPRLRSSAFAFLFISLGVGAGIALNGRLWTGRGWAGEVGQLRIRKGRGSRRSFGERLAIDGLLAEQMQALGLSPDDLDALAEAVDAEDRGALRVVDRYAESLSEVIQVMNAVLDLDEVIIDFPSEALFQRLLPRVGALIADSTLQVKVSATSVGHTACVTGAALCALSTVLDQVEQRQER